LFNFPWKNKRAGLYQDREKGGIRMTDVEIMIKALRLLDPKAFDPRNEKLVNNSRLLLKQNRRIKLPIKM